MNTELMEALNILEKEKSISKDVLLEAIEQSLIQACKNHFGKADNVKVTIDRETGDMIVLAEKEVVDEVFDPALEISLAKAQAINPSSGRVIQAIFRTKCLPCLKGGPGAPAPVHPLYPLQKHIEKETSECSSRI